MSVVSHLASLRLKHEELDRKIESELRSPGADDLSIAAMKRQKLHIKEEISRLSSTH
ncbi:YdcH family protein [Rhodobacteraceae bacterium NNCM2]|nr:YdcH family protein [Coraliihabitans acroporae]